MASNTKRRWGDCPADADDDAALTALLNESNARAEKLAQGQTKARQALDHGRNREVRGSHQRDHGGKPIVEDDRQGHSKRRRRWKDRDPEGPEQWGDRSSDQVKTEEGEKPDKVKAEFGLSGALAADTKTGNVRNGVTLKFSEPAEARIPNTRWRLYVFRKKSADVKSNDSKDDLIDTYHISKQSSYLFGREHAVADIPVDHPSLSKQHAVLQYRSLPSRSMEIGKPDKLQCKPYIMDLESTNGTFLNGVRIDPARYYELRRGDVITLGASTREYVLLTEQSARTGI